MEAIALLLGAFGATSALWSLQNRARRRDEARRKKALTDMIDDSMQVVVALAKHEAASRQQPMTMTHVLVAMLQAEEVIAAIDQLGGDIAALEAAGEAALDKLAPAADPRDANERLGAALGYAVHQERKMTCADVLNLVARAKQPTFLDVPPVSAHALLFALVHHTTQPPTTLAGETAVHVIIGNDDYTTHDFVIQTLHQVFGLSAEDAAAKTRTAHETGRAIVGRFASEVARDKIDSARARAREAGAPLWLGVEVC